MALVCRISIGFLSETEKSRLLPLLRPKTKYDFQTSGPGHIENRFGKFFRLPMRCWIVLSHAVCEPLGFDEAEVLLNQVLNQQNVQNEIILDENAIGYIVSKTNAALTGAESTCRLSAANGSFSIRKIPEK